MTNYGKMAKDAAARKNELQSELAAAKKTVAGCESELAVLEQILGALKGAAPAAPGRRRKAGRRAKPGRRAKAAGRGAAKRGKWRPGRPGRPPKWFVEQQKAAGGGKPGRKAGKRGRKARRGRRPGRRKAAAPAAPPAEAPAAVAAS